MKRKASCFCCKLLIPTLLTLTLLLQLTACSSNPVANKIEAPDYVFVQELTDLMQLNEKMHFSGGACVIGDTLYFSAFELSDSEKGFSADKIFSANLDGSNLTLLQNFTTTSPPPVADAGRIRITAMTEDHEGNLWITESAEFYTENLPDNFESDSSDPLALLEFRENITNSVFVHKLDDKGAVIYSIEVSDILTIHDFLWPIDFAIDDEHIYIATNEKIAVYDYSGNRLFTIDVDGMIISLINLPSGNIAVNYWGLSNSNGSILHRIDSDIRALGEILESSHQLTYVFSGDDNFLYYITDQTHLYGMNADTSELVQILNLLDNNIVSENIVLVTTIGDEQVLAINRKWDIYNERQTIELVSLHKTDAQDFDKITITYATSLLNPRIRNEIIEFNRTNNHFHIEVIDYSQYSTNSNWRGGIERLSLEIIAGNVPDMLDVSGLPVEKYIAVGLLEDLYPFIDNDTDLNSEDFIENIFRKAERNGSLYYVFPLFTIFTVIGNPSILGSQHGWNLDEMLTVLEENPEADVPLGAWMTNEIFLEFLVFHNLDRFIDLDLGTAYFDNADFIRLLEFASMFPSNAPKSGDYNELEDIATGRQIMKTFSFEGFANYQFYLEAFGGELVMKGFPSVNRRGSHIEPIQTFAITSVSENKDGAWSFIRRFMTESWQRNAITESPDSIPLNNVVFDWMIENVMNKPEYTTTMGGDFGGVFSTFEVTVPPLSEAERNRFLEILNSAVPDKDYNDEFISLMIIVQETASYYFAGRITAEEAAKIIQSRASIFTAEQFG